jgi:hypothetical protein
MPSFCYSRQSRVRLATHSLGKISVWCCKGRICSTVVKGVCSVSNQLFSSREILASMILITKNIIKVIIRSAQLIYFVLTGISHVMFPSILYDKHGGRYLLL